MRKLGFVVLITLLSASSAFAQCSTSNLAACPSPPYNQITANKFLNNAAAFVATDNYLPLTSADAAFLTVLGSSGTPATTNNAVMLCQKWGGSSTAGTDPCFYASAYKTAAMIGAGYRVQGGFVEVIDLSGWNGSGLPNFIEGWRTQAILEAGTSLGSAYGANAVAGEEAGTTHNYLVGGDSDLYNYSADATPAFNPLHFEAGFLAESSGTKKVQAAFAVNPFLGQTNTDAAQFIDGFYVPSGAGSVTSPISNSAFRSDATSIYGLDLTHAPTSFGAIGINNNTPIRAMNNTQTATINMLAVSTANNILVCDDATASGCKIATPGLTTAVQGALIVNQEFIVTSSHTPSSSSDTGATGTIAWDSSFLYVAVATNTWKRVAISTW